jgi:putative NADH-flavin reductase
MNIAVIAANGRSGRIFVQKALQAGHQVRAGVHGSSALTPQQGLTIVPCDATKAVDLRSLCAGSDVVVSLIGHVKGSPPRVQTDAMRQLVIVLAELGIRRVLSLTGTGVRFAGDHIPLIDRILNLAVTLIDPQRVADGKAHVAVLQQSDLDWTVLRVLKLQNIPPRPFVLREHGPTKTMVSREDVAAALLQVAEANSFVRQAPILSRP